MISLNVLNKDFEKIDTDVFIIPVTEEDMKKGLKEYDALTLNVISRLYALKDFEGKNKQIAFVMPDAEVSWKRICLVGLGEEKKLDETIFYSACATACVAAQKKKAQNYALVISERIEKICKPQRLGCCSAKAVLVSTYQFQKYLNKEDAKLLLPTSLTVLCSRNRVQIQKGLEEGACVAECMNWARELGNHPAGNMTPLTLARTVKEGMKGLPVAVTILDKKEMEKLGMGCMLGVSQGSDAPPAFVILEYKNGGKKSPAVFCGKGITFDSGGISIKPSAAMDEMKFDMLGAAAVAGGIRAIAMLKLKVHVVGLLACAENLPSGSALRPGDILTAMNGTTIEVQNTDAEGRLVLADALSYAAKYNPKYIVDFATLTGACVVALGSHFAGLFSNNPKVCSLVWKAGENSGDRLWELPVTSDYDEHIKSNVADIKNLGIKNEAGASSAAAFLKHFVKGPWAHIDIAGCAWQNNESALLHCGATGFGVHLIVEMLKKSNR